MRPWAPDAPDDAVGPRVVATLIDGCCMTALAFAFGAPFGRPIPLFLLLVQLVVYPPLATAAFGRTIGMARRGLRVRMRDGRRVTPAAAILRGLARPVEWATVGILALLSTLLTGRGRRQRLGDLLTGTFVVLDDAAAGRPQVPGPRVARSVPANRALVARGWAAVVDAAVALLAALAVAGPDGGDASAAVFFGVLFALPLLGELFGGQSIGKWLMCVEVRMVDGRPLTPGAAVVRNLMRVVDAVPALYVLGLLAMLTAGGARRQRFGDLAARTIVVPDGRRELKGLPGGAFLVVCLIVAAGSFTLIVAGDKLITVDDSKYRASWVPWCQRHDVLPGGCGCVFDEVGASRVARWSPDADEWRIRALPDDISAAAARCRVRP